MNHDTLLPSSKNLPKSALVGTRFESLFLAFDSGVLGVPRLDERRASTAYKGKSVAVSAVPCLQRDPANYPHGKTLGNKNRRPVRVKLLYT